MNTVWVLLDDSKAGYDAGGIFVGVFSSKEAAEKYLERYDKYDRSSFSIDEYNVDEV